MREYLSLGGCGGTVMSNTFGVTVFLSLSLQLATWLGGRGMSFQSIISFSSLLSEVLNTLSILTCDISIGISKSGSVGSMVTLGGCGCLYRVAFKSGLLLALDGAPQWNQYLCNVSHRQYLHLHLHLLTYHQWFL